MSLFTKVISCVRLPALLSPVPRAVLDRTEWRQYETPTVERRKANLARLRIDRVRRPTAEVPAFLSRQAE